jgi:hypothetical protein
MSTSETRWSWTDGWPVSYSRWAVGGDLGTNSTDRCVAVDSSGRWATHLCSDNRPFVCKTTSGKHERQTIYEYVLCSHYFFLSKPVESANIFLKTGIKEENKTLEDKYPFWTIKMFSMLFCLCQCVCHACVSVVVMSVSVCLSCLCQ